MNNRAVRIRYRTKNQMQEEKGELMIAGEIDAAKNLHDLGTLMALGPIKSPYLMMLLPS
jgi:hypothetical protein